MRPNRKSYLLITALILAVLLSFSGCARDFPTLDDFIGDVRDVIGNVYAEKPTAENTLLTMEEVVKQISLSLKEGEPELTLFIAKATEDDVAHIADNISPFWGSPTHYSILKKYTDAEDIIPLEVVDVLRVKFTLTKSANWFVVRNFKDSSIDIPSDQIEAGKLAAELPSILTEIFGGLSSGETTEFETVLKIHDWLVANIEYDQNIDEKGIENGSYGALINRKTMCQGYAESLQLLLECGTNVTSMMVIGNADDGGGDYQGHAWNLVSIDGTYYQVDATFDDPLNNKAGVVNHFFFGLNDDYTGTNHKWDAAFWPEANGTPYLYYKINGLYASSLDSFKAILNELVADKRPERIEIAIDTAGYQFDTADLQYVYDINNSVENILYSEYPNLDTDILVIEPQYSES